MGREEQPEEEAPERPLRKHQLLGLLLGENIGPKLGSSAQYTERDDNSDDHGLLGVWCVGRSI
jgi:hypothetical protein